MASTIATESTQQQSPLPDSFSKSDYIQTAAQNYISRSAHILGAPHLETKGKSIIQAGAVIHGDYGARIHIGRYCYIGPGVVLTPSVVPRSNDPSPAVGGEETNLRRDLFGAGGDGAAAAPDPAAGDATARPGAHERALPLVIGSHTRIGPNARIHAVGIGSCVRIGANCVLAPRSRVHDCCVIEDDCHVPPDLVVPPFSRVSGSPGRIVGTLPECTGGEFVEGCVQDYLHFLKMLNI